MQTDDLLVPADTIMTTWIKNTGRVTSQLRLLAFVLRLAFCSSVCYCIRLLSPVFCSFLFSCIVLDCIVLYSIVLSCIVLYSIVFNCLTSTGVINIVLLSNRLRMSNSDFKNDAQHDQGHRDGYSTDAGRVSRTPKRCFSTPPQPIKSSPVLSCHLV